MFCGVFALFIAPAYARMFFEFGSHLPALTQLMLRTVPPLVLATLAIALLTMALLGRMNDRWRDRLFIAAAIVGIGGGTCCLVAVSLPEVSFVGDLPRR